MFWGWFWLGVLFGATRTLKQLADEEIEQAEKEEAEEEELRQRLQEPDE